LYYIQKALKLNPVPSPIYQFTLAAAYIVLEDYDKALHALRLGARIGPAFMPNQIQLTLMYALLNMDEEMKAQRTLMLAMLGGDLSRKPRQPWTTPNLENFYEDIGLRIGI
jgi:tetratricopeptide (TPR) repeat protein